MPRPDGGQKQDYLKDITPVLMPCADSQGNTVETDRRMSWVEMPRYWAGTWNQWRGDSASPGRQRLLVGNTCPEGQWTVFALPFDDGDMNETTSPTHRRSGRAFHKMRVQAQGRAHNGKKFKEACETVVVNAHGGLLMLKHEIDNGEMIVLTNPETLEEQECRVVYQGEPCERGQRIGVEFLTPAPRFWGLEFGELAAPSGGDASAVH